MLLLLFNLFLFLTKQYLSFQIENKIFFNEDELNKLKFTINTNDYTNIDVIDGSAPTNVTPPVYANYAYDMKVIHDLIHISDRQYLNNYFLNAEKGTCEYALNNLNHYSSQVEHLCNNLTFCGVNPKNKHVRDKLIKDTPVTFCYYFFNNMIYVFFVSDAKRVSAKNIYEEIFFYDTISKLDCLNKKIHILYFNIFAQNGTESNLTTKLLNECNGKNKCEIRLSQENAFTSFQKNFFYAHISYMCEPECSINSPNEECFGSLSTGTYKTCSYGYKKIEPPTKTGRSELCEENSLCYGKKCNLNSYCDKNTKQCVCFKDTYDTGEAEMVHATEDRDDTSCIYKDFCKKLNCPEGSKCVKDSNKNFPECQCENNKIFFRNACYSEEVLKNIISMKETSTDIIYRDQVYTKYTTDYRYIALECPQNYSIEVIQATGTCFGVDMGHAKLIYFTEDIMHNCNGKENCHFARDIYSVYNKYITTFCPHKLYKYSYICKAKQTLDINYQPISSIDTENDKRVVVFSGSLNSTLTCDGGKITIHKVHLITEESCPTPPDNLTETLKKYCDGLTDCNVGLIYQFDRYCVNGSMLYISYQCSLFDETCKSMNAVPVGNKHKHICVCKNPYVLKEAENKCQMKDTNVDEMCTYKEKFREIKKPDLNINTGLCECQSNFTNINGECVSKQCDLRCPLNKTCVYTDRKKQCQCPNGAIFDGTKCKCQNNKLLRNGKCVEPNLCLEEENKNKCNRPFEHCEPKIGVDAVECVCDNHYERKGNDCVPIDYCKDKTCSLNERCENSPPNGECVCIENFEKKNNKCVYINKCEINNGDCPSGSLCIYNENGPHTCVCQQKGYYMADNICLPEDKCSNETLCPENSICVSVADSNPLCFCTFNYLKKDGQCVIRDKCLDNNGGCDRNAICRMVGENVECLCKDNYIKNDSSKCVPKTKKYDRNFHFPYDKDPIVILGNCGLLHFNIQQNQIVWKIKDIEESYIFDYIYPTSGNIEVTIRNEEYSSIIYVKKTQNSEEIYDDFHVNHHSCSYSNWFFYLKSEQKLFVA